MEYNIFIRVGGMYIVVLGLVLIREFYFYYGVDCMVMWFMDIYFRA